MLMQNFGATIKKHYGMLWYFLEWPIATRDQKSFLKGENVHAEILKKLPSIEDFNFC